MVAITIPAGAVIRSDGDPVMTRKAQVQVSAGQVGYVDLSNASKLNLADKNTEAAALAKGIFVNSAEANEDATLALNGALITVASAVFTKGVIYCLGDSGAIIPQADIASGDYVTILGVAESTTTLRVNIFASGVVL